MDIYIYIFGNSTSAPKILRGSHLSYAAPISKCEWTSAMLRSSDSAAAMPCLNIKKLRGSGAPRDPVQSIISRQILFVLTILHFG